MTHFKTEAQKLELAAYIDKVAADWPPLTQGQIDRVVALLHGGNTGRAVAHERPEAKAIRDAEAGLAKARQAFRDALDGCHGCGLSRKVHAYQKGYAAGYHDFVELTPDDTVKVAQASKKRIASAERALEKARAA